MKDPRIEAFVAAYEPITSAKELEGLDLDVAADNENGRLALIVLSSALLVGLGIWIVAGMYFYHLIHQAVR